jgi:hypothetical protein
MSIKPDFQISNHTPAAETGKRLVKFQASGSAPDPIFLSWEVDNDGGEDARTTTTETISQASRGKLVRFTNASAIAVTLDSTVDQYFWCAVEVTGAGSATFTPSTGTLNGAGSQAIAGGSSPNFNGGILFFNGTNWWLITGGGGGGGGGFTNGQVGITIDGGGNVPGTGSKAFYQMPYDCTIVSWTMLGDVSGSAQITVKKSTYAAFPTTSSIVASAPPNLSSAQKNTSSTLTGWTTALAKGDILEFNLDSIATIARVMLALAVTRSD